MNSARKIVILGSTGSIARHLIPEALAQGHQVTAIARPGSEGKLDRFAGRITIVPGDPNKPGDWMDAFAGQNQFIHMIGIIKEDLSKGVTFESAQTETARLGLEASKAGGVEWVTHMSAVMNIPGVSRKYIATKRAAEELIVASGIPYTIFRPSMVYGGSMPFGRYSPVVVAAPVMGLFAPRLRPVEVHVLVGSLLGCYGNPSAKNQVLLAPQIYALARSSSSGT